MRSIVLFIAAVLTAVGCASNVADAGEVRALHAAGAPIIDVRTTQEWRAGHLDDSTLTPVHELDTRLAEVAQIVGGDRSKPLIIVCRSGTRAQRALQLLKENGFTAVVNGGAWKNLR